MVGFVLEGDLVDSFVRHLGIFLIDVSDNM